MRAGILKVHLDILVSWPEFLHFSAGSKSPRHIGHRKFLQRILIRNCDADDSRVRKGTGRLTPVEPVPLRTRLNCYSGTTINISLRQATR